MAIITFLMSSLMKFVKLWSFQNVQCSLIRIMGLLAVFFLDKCMSFLLCLTRDPAASASDSCIPLSLGPLPYFLVTLVCCYLIQYHDVHCLTCTVIELSQVGLGFSYYCVSPNVHLHTLHIGMQNSITTCMAGPKQHKCEEFNIDFEVNVS